MKKATLKQLMKLKELKNNINNKDKAEKIAVFTFFLQVLKDIDELSQFHNDFKSKLFQFDNIDTSNDSTQELIELMKYSIEYYGQD